MANTGLWVAGQSGNPGGRPKGTRRTFKRTIDRFFSLDITQKELHNIYTHLKPGKEQVDFLKALLPYHIAPLQADVLSEAEMQTVRERIIKLQQENQDLKRQLENVRTKAS